MTMTDAPRQPAGQAVRHVREAREKSGEERLRAAMRGFIEDFGPQAALFMEACLHCGQCAEACHFYVRTGDPRYTPILKIEPFKQAYKREVSPFAFLYRGLGLTRSVTLDELERWQELIYDSCNMCGRCSLICPTGIDIADLVEKARHGMFDAGLVPHDFLGALDEKETETGSPFGITVEGFRQMLAEIGQKRNVDIFIDKDKADVILTLSSIDVKMYPDSIAAMAAILNHLGVSWCFRTDGFDADNVSLTAGDRQGQARVTKGIVEAAIRCGAKTLILPECGHSYTEMRWEAANTVGFRLPFHIQHITEYVADRIQDGSLQLIRIDQSATFHDPCQVTRRSGRGDAPRVILKALGVDLHELPDAGDMNWCCGGGGGVALISRAQPLRDKAFEIKKEQVAATGMDTIFVSCSGCRQTFEHAVKKQNWGKKILSVTDLVAAHLAPKAGGKG